MLRINDLRPYNGQMVDLLTRLVSIESPSTDKAAVDRLGTVVRAEAERLEAILTVDSQPERGDHLIARWAPQQSGKLVPHLVPSTIDHPHGFLFLCHMDTVFELGWLEQHPLRFETSKTDGEKMYGPGSADMKAGIVLVLTVIRALQEKGQMPKRSVTALFTTDEEIGSESSRSLIESLASRSELVLCLEAGMADGGLKTARKGTGEMVISTRGVAAHAGVDHQKGRNAIEELTYHIQAAQKLTDYNTGTTTSVGKVTGGGRTNVVPEAAKAVIDLRVPNQTEAERIETWAQSLQPVLEGTEVSAQVWFDRPPMPRDAIMSAAFSKAQGIAAQLGINLKEGSTGGGSDANFVAALGIPVLDGLGAIGGGAHSQGEYILVESLVERAALVGGILTDW